MSIEHYPHIIPDIGEMDKFWEFFGFWAKRYGYVLRCLKEGAEGDKHFTDYELSRRKKVYVSSTFYWGERTFLTDVSTFGAWTSEYADASLIDDVIGQVEVSSLDVMSDVFAKIRERGRDFIREPDEFECCYYKLSVPNKGTDEIYCLPFDDKMFACEFREKFGFVS